MTMPAVLRRGRLVNGVLEIIVPCILVAAWWLITTLHSFLYFPALSRVVDSFLKVVFSARFSTDIAPSVTHFVVGFAVGAALGFAVGVPLGLFNGARQAVYPTSEFLRSLPGAALVPVGLGLFGPGATYEIVLIAYASIWAVLISTVDGIRSAEPLLHDFARVYGVRRGYEILHIVLPASMPRVFAGLRVAVATGISITVIANMISSSGGIGFYVMNAQQTFDIEGTWAGVFVIGLIGVIANLVLVAIEARVIGWHRRWRRSALTGS